MQFVAPELGSNMGSNPDNQVWPEPADSGL
jgi:hypothetical protein